MADGLLILLVLLNAYIIALFLLHRAGKLRGPILELVGPLLMWRTEQGKGLIDRVSRPKRFWKAFGDAGVVLTFVAGIAVLALLVWQLSLLFTHREILRAAAPSPEYFLVLPGVNPLIPVWYGILGLVVALVVHEGAHGVLARAHDIKVKSLGLLFFIVPIGAFVEPDDEELEKARTREKARVFAAGVTTNVVVAVLAGVLLSGAFWAAAQPAQDGIAVTNTFPLGATEGAMAAGIQPGMIITAIDGRTVRTAPEFSDALNNTVAGLAYPITVWDQGQLRNVNVLMADKYRYFEATAPDQNRDEYRGKGFLGVSSVPMELMRQLRNINSQPFDYGLAGLGFYVSLPFQGFSPMPENFQDFFVLQGPLGALPPSLFWILADSLYWIFWLNLMVGTFNALPAGPLDGGQMFKAMLRGALRRRFGVARDKLVVERPVGRQVIVRGADSATQAKVERIDGIVRTTTLTVGLVILALILVPIVGPRLF